LGRSRLPWRLDVSYARTLAAYGTKAYIANALTQLNYRADVFLLNVLVSAQAVGLYAVAVGIGERLWILSFAVGTILLPRIAALQGQEEARQQLTAKVARHVFWLGVVGAGALAALAPRVIVLLFGTVYESAGLALRCLLPGLVLFNISRVLGNDIAGRGRPELNAYMSAAVAGFNIVANLWAMPRYGMLGASCVAALSYSLDATLKIAVYQNLTTVPWTDIVFLQRADFVALSRWLRHAQGGA
jgi:O-antigen/teichoic acid export membrane protein